MRRRPPRPLVVAVSLACSLAAVAQSPELVDNDDRFGLVKKMVEPKLTAAQRQQARGGYVDVYASLTPLGELLDASVEADRAETNVVLEPLREALPRWRFRTPPDPDCMPVKDRVHFRILFEGGRYRTQIRVMEEKAPSRDDPLRVTHREPPRYPRFLLEQGAGGVTYNRTDIAPDGHVTRVVSTPFGAGLGEKELRALGRASRDVLLQWRFNAAPEGSQEMRTSCQTFFFNITD
jgi:hypothetical protein